MQTVSIIRHSALTCSSPGERHKGAIQHRQVRRLHQCIVGVNAQRHTAILLHPAARIHLVALGQIHSHYTLTRCWIEYNWIPGVRVRRSIGQPDSTQQLLHDHQPRSTPCSRVQYETLGERIMSRPSYLLHLPRTRSDTQRSSSER